MSRCLVYTSPARGHLYPMVDTLLELRRRGHEVHVRTLASEVGALRAVGLHAEPIAPEIEQKPLDDSHARSPEEGVAAVLRTFGERAHHEVPDLQHAIAQLDPDLLLIDVATAGAAAVAEASQRPWAQWSPFFHHVTAGPGAETVVTLAPFTLLPAGMEVLNDSRSQVGLSAIADAGDAWRAPLHLYFTAEPFDISRSEYPSTLRMVGPGLWEPAVSSTPDRLDRIGEPLVLVTTSSERQADDALIGTTLDALGAQDVHVVATTVAHDPDRFRATPNATIERWLPHGQLVHKAVCVVCHGGMGITQRALAVGTPVCVVPFGRDQYEVAGRVAASGAGTVVMPDQLSPTTLRAAIREAMTMRPGAARVAAGFARAGGAHGAADSLESLHATTVRRAETVAP